MIDSDPNAKVDVQDLSIIECTMVVLGNTNEVYAVEMLQIVGWHSYHFSMGRTLSQRLGSSCLVQRLLSKVVRQESTFHLQKLCH